MNKIKLLYDVVKTMKEKDVFIGDVKAEVRKDNAKVFGLEKEFEKNTANGQVKVKLHTEVDHDGKKVKHESSTEFNMQDCCGPKHHGFMKYMHHHHHGEKCCGGKGKLAKAAFLLKVLNDMKVEEQGDEGTLLSIHINEIPEDLKKTIHEKMEYKHKMMKDQEQSCCCIKELCTVENVDVNITIQINKNSEVEKVRASVNGKLKDESNEIHEIDLDAELNLTW
ncbi:MAG: hypothetical protein ACOYVK_11310 [Bacillota bacterium]